MSGYMVFLFTSTTAQVGTSQLMSLAIGLQQTLYKVDGKEAQIVWMLAAGVADHVFSVICYTDIVAACMS